MTYIYLVKAATAFESYWGTQILGKFLLENETIEARQSLPHQEANSQRLPSRGLLRVWHLFLFSLSNLALVLSSLPPSTSRSPCWQGAGVNSWSLPLERSAQLARLWPSFTAGTDKAHIQVSWYRSIYIAKNAWKAEICQVLRRCWVREHHEGDCSGRHQGLAADHDSQSKSEKPYWHNAWTKDNRRLDYFAKAMEWSPESLLSFFPVWFLSTNSLYKIFQSFLYFVQTLSPCECFIS